jgi:seryl-tRNA synthetase
MIDIEILRKDPERVRQMLRDRQKSDAAVDQIAVVDSQWRKAMQQAQDMRVKQKALAQERKIEEAKALKEELKGVEADIARLEQERYGMLLEIPNLPFDDVPRGKNEAENVVLFKKGEPRQFAFPAKDHMEIGEKLGIIDTQTAAKVSGSRFYYLKGKGALLEFALMQYAIDTLAANGFEPAIVPIMIRPEVYERMGRLSPSQREERYYLPADDLYLIGSAEHTLGPLHMDYVFKESELPKRYVGFSTCLRREAGTYGKDTRGILRAHQFDKVEMYSFCDPEKSEQEHLFLRSMQEKMYSELEIPYQVIAICTGDMGPTDARQFDIEAWIPSQGKYREVASCSNTTDYQTRGINAKVRRPDGSSVFAHALNATGIALGRTIIAIIENHQREDGSVAVPKVLQPYLKSDIIG